MVPNVRLIYASTARSGLMFEDVKSILETATIRNDKHDITGMLCYHQGAFLQAVEGPRSYINQLYRNLVGDPRHLHCELLQYQEIGARDFSEWSMKLLVMDGPLQRALEQQFGNTHFEPRLLTGSELHNLLWQLAILVRESNQ